MRIAVTGGRNFNDRDFVFSTLDRLESGHIFRGLIHGACPTGLDMLAAEWQRDRIKRGRAFFDEMRRAVRERPAPANCNLWVWGFPARWDDLETPPVVIRRRSDGKFYNAAAGSIRNGEMLRQGKPAMLIAFPGGRGTADCVKQARGLGIPVIEVKP